ncbi:MAG: tetratricopeptide repeat protein [Cytophagales bacterium]|nr:tetratricopeptide repeat protein [Armatimonadota bacterium]
MKSFHPLSLAVFSLLVGVRVSVAAPPIAAPAPPPTRLADPKSTVVQVADPRQGQKLFAQAVRLTEEGQTIAAEETYRKLLKQFPGAGAAWANLGLLEGRDNRLAGAESHLRKATVLEPKAAPFWAQLASIQLRRGNPQGAETTARRAVLLDPKNQYGLGNLATALLRQNRYADAVAPLKTLRALDGGGNQQVTLSLVTALVRAKRSREALIFARKLAAQSPAQPNYQVMLGDLASQTGDLGAAQKAYARASVLAPKEVRTGINAAMASEMRGRPAEAKAQIEKVIAANPEDPRPHFQLGRLYYLYPTLAGLPAPGNYQKAETSFREAMVLDPKNSLYLTNLGLAMMLQGAQRYPDATNIFRASLSVAPKDSVARMGLGYIAERKQDGDTAIGQYRAILAYDPGRGEARRRLADLLYATGQKEAAYKEFQILADRTPGEGGLTALKALASLRVENQDWPQARKAYERLLARRPKDSEALVGLGRILEQERRPDAARKKYEAALAAAPGDPDAYEALGTLLQNQRKPAEATWLYERFVRAVPKSNAAHWQLAQLYREQRRDDDALREMRKLTVTKTDPTRISYLLAPSSLLLERKRHDEAVADLSRLAAENPGVEESREIRYALAVAQERAGRTAEAEKTLTRLVEEGKDTGDKVRANVAAGAFYERFNRLEDAVQRYQDAASADPGSNPARVGLRRVFDTLKRPEAAVAYLEMIAFSPPDAPDLAAVASVAQFYREDNTPGKYLDFARRAAEKYPRSAIALKLYAQTLLESGGSPPKTETRQGAIDLYRQASLLDPKDADAFYQLGLQTEALGRKEDAIAAYKSAVVVPASAAGTDSANASERARVALTRLGVAVPPALVAPVAGRKSPAVPVKEGNAPPGAVKGGGG